MKRTTTVLTLVALLAAAAAHAPAETVTCKASRDVWLSAMGVEADYNMGAARTMKLKVWQEFALVDFDVSALKGKTITAAWVSVKPTGGCAGGPNLGSFLKWLTVSTVSCDWVEGRSDRYGKDEAGRGATFNESSYKTSPWGWRGAKAWDVILGNGNTLRSDQAMVVAGGRLKCKIDPRLVQALVARASHGLLLMDGSTSVGVNCTIASRESGQGPVLIVTTSGDDTAPPAAPTDLKVAPAPNWATPTHGAAAISLTVPAGTLAYHVTINGKPAARWQVPFAARPGSTQTFPIRDLPGGQALAVEVAAVDAAGNVSKPAKASGQASTKLTVPDLPKGPFTPKVGPPQTLGQAKVWAFPEITKVHPVSGKVLSEKVAGDIRRANAVWDGATGTIRLAAARGEIVSFQLAVEGPAKGVKVSVSDLGGPGTISAKGVRLWRNWYVQGQSEYAIGLTGAIDCPMADNGVGGQTL